MWSFAIQPGAHSAFLRFGRAARSGACVMRPTLRGGIPSRRFRATHRTRICTGARECWRSRPLRAPIRCCAMAPSVWRGIIATWSMPTARRSSGWATPGGWDCATAALARDFERLAADRVHKGFHRGADRRGPLSRHAALRSARRQRSGLSRGHPNYARINPAYFDMADLRIQHLVDRGLAPCIVGCWGYYLPILGMARMKQHWRYLVARWGAYPAIWCLAGEGTMPYYLSHGTGARSRPAEARLDGNGALRARPSIRSITRSPFILPIARASTVDDRFRARFRHAADRPQRSRQHPEYGQSW